MTEPRLRLNLTKQPDAGETAAKVKQASAKKKVANETLEEAWQRILSMKNSEADQARLIEVKNAMLSNLVGRDSEGKRFSKAEALRMYKVLAESQREQKLADLVKSTPKNYRLITTERQFDRLIDELKGEPIIAIDTE